MDWNNAGVFKITEAIYQGKFPDAHIFRKLNEFGIHRILNVSEVHYTAPEYQLAHVPIQDLKEIPLDSVTKAIEAIHQSIELHERIYVHCIAGQNRSPACIFLALVAMGVFEENAEKLIDDATLDAVPRHPRLVTQNVIDFAETYAQSTRLRLAASPRP